MLEIIAKMEIFNQIAEEKKNQLNISGQIVKKKKFKKQTNVVKW